MEAAFSLSHDTFLPMHGTFQVIDEAFWAMHGTFWLSRGTFLPMHGTFQVSREAFLPTHGTFWVIDGTFSVSRGAFCAIDETFLPIDGTFSDSREGLSDSGAGNAASAAVRRDIVIPSRSITGSHPGRKPRVQRPSTPASTVAVANIAHSSGV